MTATCVESRPWPRRRWWWVITLIFAAQLGLIFWLGDSAPITPRPAAPAPEIRMTRGAPSELQELEDPTLFALPHRHGFSGLAWLGNPGLPTSFFKWSDEGPRWLAPAVPQVGAIFAHMMQTSDWNSSCIFDRPEAMDAEVDGAGPAARLRQSTLRVEGDLKGRRLLTPMVLTPQPGTELLTNSEVRIVVNAVGQLESVPVLIGRSGNSEADKEALRLAGAVRFEPIRMTGGPKGDAASAREKLTWGRLVFDWSTVPMPPTNGTSGP